MSLLGKLSTKQLQSLKDSKEHIKEERTNHINVSFSKTKTINLPIKNKDDELCKLLKEEINDKYVYGDFLGKEGISYTTFYAIEEKGRVTFSLLKKFLSVIGKEVTITIK